MTSLVVTFIRVMDGLWNSLFMRHSFANNELNAKTKPMAKNHGLSIHATEQACSDAMLSST
eukprot:CAMPEP_0201951668 /NCGR_PEP_ID=MMETSP0904-20121228/608_1 /ASSEMBLY_ACC=CAM_ASM_000553 /TAXON_ID=420261 /ORGANISM="Thalassiosira antarctica, Strain CCMP982" /LENGTH=60 /DNA_ID=CAMNT_0048495153 /DNA_START=121 /DNA_END=299 /DNA_ORIENTATION=-